METRSATRAKQSKWDGLLINLVIFLPDDHVMTLLHVACLELPGTLQVGIVVLFDVHDCIIVVMMLFVDWMIGSR